MEDNFPISKELIQELWARTYNSEGKPDWSHIFPYYDENIIFEDSIQKITGIEEFKALCARLAKRCEKLNMRIHSIVMESPVIFFQWEMVMEFKKYPSTSVFGCTKLTIGENNRIVHQRDYFDLWGDIFNNIPWFHRPYRKFLLKYFG